MRFATVLGLEAEINGENRLEELLANDDREGDACMHLLQSSDSPRQRIQLLALPKTVLFLLPHGPELAPPQAGLLLFITWSSSAAHAWTVTLDVWARGGGA